MFTDVRAVVVSGIVMRVVAISHVGTHGWRMVMVKMREMNKSSAANEFRRRD